MKKRKQIEVIPSMYLYDQFGIQIEDNLRADLFNKLSWELETQIWNELAEYVMNHIKKGTHV